MQRTMKRVGALILAVAMLVTFMPSLGLAEQAHADEGSTVKVDVLTQEEENKLLKAYQGLEVSSEAAEEYGYTEPEKAMAPNEDGQIPIEGKVTTLDVLVTVMKDIYGDAFTKETAQDYLVVNSGGTITKIFGGATTMTGFTVNGKNPLYVNNDSIGSLIFDTVVEDGDSLRFFRTFEDDLDMGGLFMSMLYFDGADQKSYEIRAGKTLELTTSAAYAFETMMGGPESSGTLDPKDIEISVLDSEGKVVSTVDADEEGKAEIQFVNPGEYQLVVSGYKGNGMDEHFVTPYAKVKVIKEASVYVTVSEKGLLAQAKDGSPMVRKTVKAPDLDGDGKITLVEALAEAHREYFEGGEAGFAYQYNESQYEGYDGYYSVTKLWGQDTWNTLFFINGTGVSSVVDEVNAEDMIYASLNSDDVNYADFTAHFDYDNSGNWPVLCDIPLHLSGHLGMAYLPEDLVDIDLKGVQIGIWKDGKFEPIPGAVTDEKGNAVIFIDEPGEYIITAQGSVKYAIEDYATGGRKEVDCPIMAPYSYIEIEDYGIEMSAFNKKKAEAFGDLFEQYDPAKYRGGDQTKVLTLLVKAQSKISTATKTADINAAVADAEAALKEFTTDEEYKAQEAAFKKTKISGVKAKAGKKKVTVSWKKADVDGYEISCKAGKTKKAVVKKAATVKKVVKGLTSKKKCTTKVRGFKTIGGNKVYTAWAKAKMVKVK